CLVSPGPGRLSVVRVIVPLKTRVLSGPMRSAKSTVEPGTSETMDRVVVERCHWVSRVSGPEGPGIVSGRTAIWVMRIGPSKAENCEESKICNKRTGEKGVSANELPSTVVSALGTTMTSARALVAAHDPRRARERIQAKPTPRFWNMV